MVPSRSDVSAGHSGEVVGFGSYQVRYKGNCHSPGEWRHLVHYQVAHSGVGHAVLMSRSNVSVGWAILTSSLDRSTEEDLHDG